MNLKYLPEIDTLYIYQDSRTPKILIQSKFDETVGIFVDKKTMKKKCGYEIENASHSLFKNIYHLELGLKETLGLVLYFTRVLNAQSQESMAKEINVSLSTYKSLEKAEQNLSFDIFETINRKFPKVRKIMGEKLLSL